VGRTLEGTRARGTGRCAERGRKGGAKYTDARVHVLRKVLTAPIVTPRARTGVISDILFRMGNRTDERELVEWELSSLSLRASPVSKNPRSRNHPRLSVRAMFSPPSFAVCPALTPVLRLRCSRNVAPVPPSLSRCRVAPNIPLDIRAVPSPPRRALRSGSEMDRIAMKGIRSRARISVDRKSD